ncbi:MAG: anti-sigma factor family protein [Christensenellales bacterium]
MDCVRFEELLGKYLDHELSEEEAAEFHAHEKVCLSCAEKTKILQKALKAAAQEEEIPFECAQNWRRAVRKESSPAKRIQFYRRLVSVAAALLVLLAGVGLWQGLGNRQEADRQSTEFLMKEASLSAPKANGAMPEAGAASSAYGMGTEEAAQTPAPQDQTMLGATSRAMDANSWTVLCSDPGGLSLQLADWAKANGFLVSFNPGENSVILHPDNAAVLTQWLKDHAISPQTAAVNDNASGEITVFFVKD